MNIEDKNGTTVLRRTTEYKPPKSWRTWLIGRPLQTADAPHQTIGKLIGLAVFASDALSSTAYATQEMLVILAVLGAAAYQYVFPLSIVIVALLAVVTISYEQTIHAYPNGGGSYSVSRDNLGMAPALVAAAALLTDYVLTVAVSISSGVAQITSAFPVLFEYRVWISVAMVGFIMLINLRGVKESGRAFAIPTYFFVMMLYLTVGVGLFRYFAGTLGMVANPPEAEMMTQVQGISLFLILRAFSNGTTALTGIEAISDGITAFKEPRSRNAGITLVIMAFILGSLMLGISFLTGHVHPVPSETETLISQLARTIFEGRGVLYLAMIAATTIILIMAANTSFADFPRLSAFAAADGFLPRQLTYRGSRLVYSRGIVALALLASLLIVIFQASVTRLIPLYAIGVFMSFTLSQTGMATRWWRSGHLKAGEEIRQQRSTIHYDPNWRFKMFANGFGAFCTFAVMIIFAVTKFAEGAWVVVILIPSVVLVLLTIHRHYVRVAQKLSLDHYGTLPQVARHRVILLISGVHRGSLAGLRYARMLSDDITAVHVSIDSEETEKVQRKWEVWGDGLRLVILESPYRLMVEPLLEYIDELDEKRQPNELITIVVPQFIPKHFLSGALHARTADTLRNVLLNRNDIVITEVPYNVE
jgi:amino acid transporter